MSTQRTYCHHPYHPGSDAEADNWCQRYHRPQLPRVSVAPDFTVETIERRTRPGRMPSLVFGRPGTPDTHGWYARVTTPDGAAVDVSQMDGETEWYIDAIYGPTGLPSMLNGFGARYCAVYSTIPAVAEALTAARDAVA